MVLVHVTAVEARDLATFVPNLKKSTSDAKRSSHLFALGQFFHELFGRLHERISTVAPEPRDRHVSMWCGVLWGKRGKNLDSVLLDVRGLGCGNRSQRIGHALTGRRIGAFRHSLPVLSGWPLSAAEAGARCVRINP